MKMFLFVAHTQHLDCNVKRGIPKYLQVNSRDHRKIVSIVGRLDKRVIVGGSKVFAPGGVRLLNKFIFAFFETSMPV
jgi:phenylacetate-coenzyme A ligase PaaK-like adenylate-forming protein